jgi:tetratricopeptide (TPR) repeat protein
LAELAHHIFRGPAEGSNLEKAIDYTCRAAEHAKTNLAYEDAVTQYEQALQALESRPGYETRRCEVLIELGQLYRQTGNLASVQETFHKAADLARKLVPQVGQTHAAALLGRVALGFAGEWVSTLGVMDYRAIDLLEEALQSVGETHLALRASLLARLAMELWFSAPQDRKERLRHEAVSCARRSGDDRALALTLNMHNLVLWDPRNVEERLSKGREIVTLARKAGDHGLTLEGYSWRISGLLGKGDPAALDDEVAAHSQLAEELRQPLYRWRSMWWATKRLLLRGRFAEAEQSIQHSFAFGQKFQSSPYGELVLRI